MLRAKPILTFSSYARSILLNGPRFGAADGGPCTSGDTENSTPIEPNPQTNKPPGFPSPEKTRLIQRCPTRTKAVHHEPAPQIHVITDPIPDAPPVFSNPFLKAGVATVGFISALLNHELPSSEWNGAKHMVSPAAVGRPGVNPPKVKPIISETTKYSPGGVKDSGSKAGPRIPAASGKSKREGKIPDGVSVSGKQAAGRLVEKVYRALKEVKSGREAEEELGKMNCSMDAYQANQVLKQLQDSSVALGLFYWLKRQPGFEHDSHTYTTMVGILGRARRFPEVDLLLGDMAGDGFRPNVVTFNRLIHSYGRANNLEEAVSVFRRMKRAGVDPDRVTYCTLIDVHAKAGFFDTAIALYRSMLEAGLSLDTFTYSVMINCLGKAGHLAAAENLFSEMAARGCVPNLVTYNIMIALQAKARNFSSALDLYREMRAAGYEPDRVSYSIVMDIMGRRGLLQEAEAVFSDMRRRKKWVPDEPFFGQLVDMWGRAGDVDKARGWYSIMLSTGLRPNVPTCNSLLSAFLRSGRREEARDVVREMLRFGLTPSLQTYTLLLSCCTEAVTAREVRFFTELMAMMGHPAHTFLLGMPCDEAGVREYMGGFLESVSGEAGEGRRGVVDAVVDFMHKAGMKEEAGWVWEAAEERGVYPGVVRERGMLWWIVNLHVMSEGTAITAVSRSLAVIRARMLGTGVGPGRVDVVTGWGRRSRVTGSSLVRKAVWELLCAFGFPFTEGGNSGCFVGCGEGLKQWLANPFVERMHLL